MSSSFSAQERANTLKEAQVAEELREFWRPTSGIRPDTIWSNIESAIQPNESRWGLLSQDTLKRLFDSARVQHASLAIALVLIILGGSLLYSRRAETLQESSGVTGTTQARSVIDPAIDRSGIPGYTDAIVQYREGLGSGEPTEIAGQPDAVNVPETGHTLTSSGISGAIAEIENPQVDGTPTEQLVASAGLIGRDLEGPISSSVEISESVFSAYETESGIGDISSDGFSAGAPQSQTQNGLSGNSGESSTSGGGGANSPGDVGAATEPDDTSTSDHAVDDEIDSDDPVGGNEVETDTDIDTQVGDDESAFSEEQTAEVNELDRDEPSETTVKGSGKSKNGDQRADSDNGNNDGGPPEQETSDKVKADDPVVEDETAPDEEPVVESDEVEQDKSSETTEKGSGKSSKGEQENDPGNGNKKSDPPGQETIDEIADDHPVVEDETASDEEPIVESEVFEQDEPSEKTVRGSGKSKNGDQRADSGNGNNSGPPEQVTDDEAEAEQPVVESDEVEQDKSPEKTGKGSGKLKNDDKNQGSGSKDTSSGAKAQKKGNAGEGSDETDGVDEEGGLDQ